MYNYNLLAKKLESLTEYFTNKLSEQDLFDVKEYIFFGEYGLAYELLCDAIVKKHLIVDWQIYEDIVNLGQLMELKEDIWIRVKYENY